MPNTPYTRGCKSATLCRCLHRTLCPVRTQIIWYGKKASMVFVRLQLSGPTEWRILQNLYWTLFSEHRDIRASLDDGVSQCLSHFLRVENSDSRSSHTTGHCLWEVHHRQTQRVYARPPHFLEEIYSDLYVNSTPFSGKLAEKEKI